MPVRRNIGLRNKIEGGLVPAGTVNMTSKSRLQELIKPSIRAMRAYHAPPADGLIKLDAMENPYSWPTSTKQEWLNLLEELAINRYPPADAQALKTVLRQSLDIPRDQDILLGNGSDEIIQILALAFGGRGKVFLSPEPGFVMYRQITLTVESKYVGVPLRADDFSLDFDAICEAILRHQPVLLFIAWPNNPTGNLFDPAQVRELIKLMPGMVIIDEAYQAFSGSSFMKALGEFDNLLLMRTLSKSGLAGLRLGYLVGQPEWIGQLDKVRLPYNINLLTQKTAEFILKQHSLLEEQARQICADREVLFKAMKTLKGITVWPSQANFLLFRTEQRPAPEVFEGLRSEGILIKNLHGAHPLLDHCLRVTVGRESENSQFLGALSMLL